MCSTDSKATSAVKWFSRTYLAHTGRWYGTDYCIRIPTKCRPMASSTNSSDCRYTLGWPTLPDCNRDPDFRRLRLALLPSVHSQSRRLTSRDRCPWIPGSHRSCILAIAGRWHSWCVSRDWPGTARWSAFRNTVSPFEFEGVLWLVDMNRVHVKIQTNWTGT